MNDVLTLKTCRDCSQSLSLDQFHKNAKCKDGLRPECRQCVKAYRAKYYQKNQNQLLAYSKTYYIENTESEKLRIKKDHEKNKNRNRERNRKWRAVNRIKLLQEKQRYYQENKERLKPYFQAYSANHPEYNRATTLRRRARQKAAAGNCSAAQWIAKCEYWGWHCYLCRTPLTIKTTHTDHRIPLSRGGSNWPANLAPACEPCNLSKSNKTEAEYLATIR